MSEVVALGIDLGTTFSCVAYIDESTGKPTVIINSFGHRTTPSYVAYDTDGSVLVGEAAKNAIIDSKHLIYDSKRMIGRQFNDVTIQDDRKLWPFDVVTDKEGKPHVKIVNNNLEKLIAPEEISAEILKDLKKSAEQRIGKPISKAVITVPAHFDNRQRHETKRAAEMADLQVIKLLGEPTAAAIAYNMVNAVNDNIVIYDLGGGTFDVSIVQCLPEKKLLVKSVMGHNHLGGQDFDQAIMQYAIDEYNKSGERKFPEDKPKVMKRLREACIDVKHKLSFVDTPCEIQMNIRENEDLICEISRQKFEELCGAKIRGTLDVIDQALKEARLTEDDIKYVLLIGGSTRIPLVKNLLSEKFGGDKLSFHINPDEAVALGAAYLANQMKDTVVQPPDNSGLDGKPVPKPRSPPNLRVENTPIMNLEVRDITPLSIGFECRGNLFNVVIPKGTEYPCKIETHSCTAYDNQSTVFSGIYEGERANVKNNYKIGEVGLRLDNKNEKQGYQLTETFEIDINGILHVSTKENATGKTADIQIKYDGGSHKEDNIEKIVEESKRHKDEDEEFRDLVRTRNSFESLAYKKKRVIEGKIKDSKLSQSDGEKALDVIQTYLNWSDEFPQDKNAYARKLLDLDTQLNPYM